MALRNLIASVRIADKAYEDFRRDTTRAGGEPQEETLWVAKQTARRTLRYAIFEETGVNVDDLKTLTQG